MWFFFPHDTFRNSFHHLLNINTFCKWCIEHELCLIYTGKVLHLNASPASGIICRCILRAVLKSSEKGSAIEDVFFLFTYGCSSSSWTTSCIVKAGPGYYKISFSPMHCLDSNESKTFFDAVSRNCCCRLLYSHNPTKENSNIWNTKRIVHFLFQ